MASGRKSRGRTPGSRPRHPHVSVLLGPGILAARQRTRRRDPSAGRRGASAPCRPSPLFCRGWLTARPPRGCGSSWHGFPAGPISTPGSTAPLAVDDEGCGYADEAREVLGLALVAAVHAPASGHPEDRSFDDPAVSAEPRGKLDAFAGEAVADATLAKPFPQVVVFVAIVCVKLGRVPTARSAAGTDRRHPAHKRLQAKAVVRVGAGDAQRQEQSVAVGDQNLRIRLQHQPTGSVDPGAHPTRQPGRQPAQTPKPPATLTTKGSRAS